MRILVTGVTGFAGGHLAEALLGEPGVELFGVARHATWPAEGAHLAAKVRLFACDLCRRDAISAVLRDVGPNQIYHLAGYAHAGKSFAEPDAAWAGNLGAARSLFDAVQSWGRRVRILSVGSGLVYGEPDRPDQAYDEQSPLRPESPYAASKAAADLVAYQVTRSPGLDVVRVRPFNHVGPRQSPQYALAHFAQQIAAIERGRQPPTLETGNLAPLRDLTDVRDMVRAYQMLMRGGRTGEVYNAATGEVHSIGDALQRLLARSPVKIEVRPRAGLVRTRDTTAVRGDAGKLRRESGWAPHIPLDQTLADTLDYWRQKP